MATSDEKELMADNNISLIIRARLLSFLERDMFTDVVLVTNTLEIPAHSIVLAGASLYFEAFLSYSCNKARHRRMSVPYDGDLVAKVVNYIYTGKISFTDDVYDMMDLQDFFQVGSLRNLISDYLMINLNQDNVARTVEVAEKFRYTDLATAARRFFQKNFAKILISDNFGDVPYQILHESLESDYLSASSSNELIYNLCRWVAFDDFERWPRLETLLNKVNPVDMETWNQMRNICVKLFNENSISVDILRKWFEDNSPKNRPTSRGSGLPRFKSTLEDVVLFIGGMEDGKFVPKVEASRRLFEICRSTLPLYNGVDYPLCEPPILIFPPLGLEHSVPFLAASDGYRVFVTSPLRNVECYDVSTNVWQPLATFPESLSLGRITTLNESLYICGQRVKGPGHQLWVLPKGSVHWRPLSTPSGSTGEIEQFVASSLGATLVGFFKTSQEVTLHQYDVTLDIWTQTVRLPKNWLLVTATSIDRRHVFVTCVKSGYSCYDIVSCSLVGSTQTNTDDVNPHQCLNTVNQSILLDDRVIVQKCCCSMGTFSLRYRCNIHPIPPEYIKKSNAAFVTVKIGLYGWPEL